MESLEDSWHVPNIPPVNLHGLWTPVPAVLRKDVRGSLLKEGPARGKRFTVVHNTRIAPMPYGINPFRKNVLNVISPSWSKSRGKGESLNDVLKRIVDTVFRGK